jgi:hypothetical protein
MKRNVSRKNGVAISTRIVGMAVMKTVPMPPVRQINLGALTVNVSLKNGGVI